MINSGTTIAFALSLLLSGLIGDGGDKTNMAKQQAQHYIQGLLQDEEPALYFWALAQVAGSSLEVRSTAAEYVQNLNLDAASSSNQCLLELFESTDGEIQVTGMLLEAYRCTGDPEFILGYLYELPSEERTERFETVSRQEYAPPELSARQQALLDKALGRELDGDDISALFETRPFKMADRYLFAGLDIDSEDTVDRILELTGYWDEEDAHESLLGEHMSAATAVFGFHLMREYNRVREYLDLFMAEDLVPVSGYKYSLHTRLGFAGFQTGYYQSALSFYQQQFIPLAEHLGDQGRILQTRLEHGTFQFSLGNIRTALEEYEFVYNDQPDLLGSRDHSVLLNNLAVSYLNVGYFDRYIQMQLQALQDAREAISELEDPTRETDDHRLKLNYLNNLYVYHRRLGSWDTALSYLEQAREFANETGNLEELASVYRAYGTYYRDHMEDLDRAETYLNQASTLIDPDDNYRDLIGVLTEESRLYETKEDYETAHRIQEHIAGLAEERGDTEGFVNALIMQARFLLDSGEPDRARQVYNRIEEEAGDLNEFRFRIQVMAANVRSRLLKNEGKLDEGQELLGSYTERVFERLKHSADMQTGHMRLDWVYEESFELLADLYMDQGNLDGAFELFEEIKNLSRFTFYNNPALKSEILTEEEMIRDHNLNNRMERLRSEFNQAEGEERAEINEQLLETRSQLNELKNKVLSAIDHEPVELRQIQRELNRNEAIVYLTVFDHDIYIGVIDHNSLQMDRVELPQEKRLQFEQTVTELSEQNTDLQNLHRIYQELFAGRIPDGKDKLYVVPDGFLYRLPMEILPVEQVSHSYSYGEGRYLVEDYSISYLNALKDLVEYRERRAERRQFTYDFTGIGVSDFEGINSRLRSEDQPLSPLPFAEQETRSIAETLTALENRRTLLNRESTKSGFKELAGDSRILHVATHSEIFDNDPLYSVIYLQGGQRTGEHGRLNGQPASRDMELVSLDDTPQDEDGLIHAYELFDMNLRNEMVMLSSCDSGAGTYIQGSGVVGLSRAFNYAGAASLVMNLWEVRDKTASEISVSFYSYLNQGMGKDEALRKAKIDYINTNNSDPYLWGSYVVYGDRSPVVNRTSPVAYVLLIGMALFFAFMILRSSMQGSLPYVHGR